jgi:transposase
VDAVLFENFMFHTLKAIREDQDTSSKDILMLLDNAVIHRHSQVLETARAFNASVLFNAEYSPWLNPIE